MTHTYPNLDDKFSQWEFQDPKMEVLYHYKPIFCGDIHLHRPYIGLIYGRYLQFRILKFPLNTYPNLDDKFSESCNAGVVCS